MIRIHAVLVCPQRGIGVLAGGKAVDSGAIDRQSVGSVVIVADLDSRLTGSTIVAVIEHAVVHNEIGGVFTIRAAVEQDGLAVGVEGAALEGHIRAAPSPDGVLVRHVVLKFAVDEGGLAEQGQLTLDGAVFIGQLVADDTIEVAFACLNGEVFEGEGRTALIVQLAALRGWWPGLRELRW